MGQIRPELDEVPARDWWALFSCLPLGGGATDRAASALRKTVSRMADEHIEKKPQRRPASDGMNEGNPGNIGWGIPDPLAEILAQHRRLGDEFYPILNSYIVPIRAKATISVTTTYCAVPASVPWSVSLWPGRSCVKAGARFQAGFARRSRCREIARRSAGQDPGMFLGAGGNGIGGEETFLQKGFPPPPNLLPKTFDFIRIPLAGCSDGKRLPLLGKPFCIEENLPWAGGSSLQLCICYKNSLLICE